jgi:hypothetical protein
VVNTDAGNQFTNRAPDSKCGADSIFYLEEQDEQKINVAEVKVKDARAAIQKKYWRV